MRRARIRNIPIETSIRSLSSKFLTSMNSYCFGISLPMVGTYNRQYPHEVDFSITFILRWSDSQFALWIKVFKGLIEGNPDDQVNFSRNVYRGNFYVKRFCTSPPTMVMG